MPVSREVRQRVREFLGLSEEIRYIFPAAGVFLTTGTVLFVVTDSAIIVVTTGYFTRTKPKGVWGHYPRSSRLGPVETGTGASFEFKGTQYEVDEEYIAVINAADAEIFAQQSLPEDPLPDL
jgi:hypothetical protein